MTSAPDTTAILARAEGFLDEAVTVYKQQIPPGARFDMALRLAEACGLLAERAAAVERRRAQGCACGHAAEGEPS